MMVRSRRRFIALLPFLVASQSITAADLPMRRKNLDYLDADALRYYLDEHTTTDYDVAIMCYAQRDKASHQIAPIWDQISRILSAGTTQSNLIVSLFDCESSDEHLELCQTARVTHYPAFVYVSLAGNNHTLSWMKAPQHVVHYPGSNWQQGDAILDWLRTMKALSNWHRANWSQRVRRVLLPFLYWGKGGSSADASSTALPLGVPPVQAEQKKLADMAKKTKETELLATRNNNLLESILFPLSEDKAPMIASDKDGSRNYTDVFALLDAEKSWESKANKDIILRSCAVELSTDYCEKWSTEFMEDWIANLPPGKTSLSEEDLEGFSNDLKSYLNRTEPYCAVLDDCVASDFTKPSTAACRPTSCPFNDATVCRYVTSCLRKSLQAEYAEALGLSLDDAAQPASLDELLAKTSGSSSGSSASKSSSTSSASSTTQDETNSKKKKNKAFSWGL